MVQTATASSLVPITMRPRWWRPIARSERSQWPNMTRSARRARTHAPAATKARASAWLPSPRISSRATAPEAAAMRILATSCPRCTQSRERYNFSTFIVTIVTITAPTNPLHSRAGVTAGIATVPRTSQAAPAAMTSTVKSRTFSRPFPFSSAGARSVTLWSAAWPTCEGIGKKSASAASSKVSTGRCSESSSTEGARQLVLSSDDTATTARTQICRDSPMVAFVYYSPGDPVPGIHLRQAGRGWSDCVPCVRGQ